MVQLTAQRETETLLLQLPTDVKLIVRVLAVSFAIRLVQY